MSVIYEPKGKAREYGELAVNLFSGCDHGCLYCYAPDVIKRERNIFHNVVYPRPFILENIKKEAPKHKGKTIFLCFTCDPFSPAAAKFDITISAIDILHEAGCFVNILTKGGERAFSAITHLGRKDKLGVTLTFDNKKESLKWEPNAASPFERIMLLRQAKFNFIQTWVSFEPVIKPDQTLKLIERVKDVADIIKIGKWNYTPESKLIN